MEAKVKSTIVPGNIAFDYIKQYNQAVYYYNKFNFDKDGKPSASSISSEPLQTLKYEEVVNKLNAMSENDKTIMDNLKKECWRIYFKAVAEKIYPELDRILGTDLEHLN
jgi:hypothetical protein